MLCWYSKKRLILEKGLKNFTLQHEEFRIFKAYFMFFQHIWNSVLFSNEFCWTWLESFSQINKFLALWFRISLLFLILSLFFSKSDMLLLAWNSYSNLCFFSKKTGILSAWHFTWKILMINDCIPPYRKKVN